MDKDSTKIVQNYAAIQQQNNPNRDIRYFGYTESNDIYFAAIEELNDGEPLNIIGHSLGGKVAIDLAQSLSGTSLEIDTLVTIDPVGNGATKLWGDNIGQWMNVTATPSEGNFSDGVARLGRFWLGTADPGAADSNVESSAHHGDFQAMMGEIGAPDAIDATYVPGRMRASTLPVTGTHLRPKK